MPSVMIPLHVALPPMRLATVGRYGRTQLATTTRQHRAAKNPRALASHLRRAQTFLRALRVDMTSVVSADPERD